MINNSPFGFHKMAGKGGVSRLLTKHRATIVRDLDVTKVLPKLLQQEVFNYSEQHEILLSPNPHQRAQVFLDLLSEKGPEAFHEFCAVLEYSNPRLLTCFLLDSQGKSEE